MADIEKCESDDPRRCQAVTPNGQCNNKAVDGVDLCIAHSGGRSLRTKNREDLRNYRLTKFHAELQRHAEAPQIKSLRDEIAILRMILEAKLNQANSINDLIIQSHTISDLVLKVEKVVSSCNKIETSMGRLLDHQAILRMADEILTIINEELDGQEPLINIIADRIMSTISRGPADEDSE